MPNKVVYSVSEQIGDASASRPHVVILGAGASLAAFRNGDRNGNTLPLMDDLIDVLDLRPLLEVGVGGCGRYQFREDIQQAAC